MTKGQEACTVGPDCALCAAHLAANEREAAKVALVSAALAAAAFVDERGFVRTFEGAQAMAALHAAASAFKAVGT